MARGGSCRGGISALLDLIDKHRGALRYDWRTRFGQSLDESVPEVIGWSEAVDLVRVLRADPSSALAAAVEGWNYPLTREGWMLADLIDIQGRKTYGNKWKTYRRPPKTDPGDQKRRGNAAGRSAAQVIAILRQFGHGTQVESGVKDPGEGATSRGVSNLE